MNTSKSKLTQSTTNNSIGSSLRPIVSGRLKRPSKDISTLSQGQSIKKPFLKQYSLAMQQKLEQLKQKITQKKKQKVNKVQQNRINDKKLEKFLLTKKKSTTTQVVQTGQKNLLFQKEILLNNLVNFLTKINMQNYKDVLIENSIDTIEILNEATQKQLQQIGISKGHALKIKVGLKKFIQQQKSTKIQNLTIQSKKNKQSREIKTKDSQRMSNSIIKSQCNGIKQVQSISIGTNDQNLEQIILLPSKNTNYKQHINNKFCLFCYQSIKSIMVKQFCSQQCSDCYDRMFKKYQNNLINAEKNFKKQPKQQNKWPKQQKKQPKQKEKQSYQQQQNIQHQKIIELRQQQEDQQTFDDGFDFLMENNTNKFDQQQFQRLKMQMGQF